MKEFRFCLESLDLHLTANEIQTLWASADQDGSGTVDFVEFATFCSYNLLHLEREKHIRSLHNAIHSQAQEMLHNDGIVKKEKENELQGYLINLFKLADSNNSGMLNHDELESVLEAMDIHLTPFEITCVLQEVDMNHDGTIQYDEFVPLAVQLIEMYRISEVEKNRRHDQEKWARKKTEQLSHSFLGEAHQSAKYIRHHVQIINETIDDLNARQHAIKAVLKNPHSGLAKQEVNAIFIRLIPGNHFSGSALRDRTLTSGLPQRQITLDELEETIFEVRRLSMMRGLLEKKEKKFIASSILSELEKVAYQVKVKTGATSLPTFISAKSCYNVLETSVSLRLNRSQILAIISWSECFDESHMMIDYKRFATYAGNMIERMLGADMQEKRASAVSKGQISTTKAMNGVTETEVVHYLKEAFKNSINKNKEHHINVKTLFQIVRDIPGLKLSKREAMAVVIAFPHMDDEHINCREFIHWCYHTLVTVCKERLISRRLPLTAAGLENRPENLNEYLQIKRLAEQMLDVLKLRINKSQLLIGFSPEVFETRAKSRPTTAETTLEAEQNSLKDTKIFSYCSDGNEEEEEIQFAAMTGQATALKELEFDVPVVTIKPIVYGKKRGNNPNNRSPTAASKTPEIEPRRTIRGTLKIMENDVFLYPEKTPLEIEFKAEDGSFNSCIPVG